VKKNPNEPESQSTAIVKTIKHESISNTYRLHATSLLRVCQHKDCTANTADGDSSARSGNRSTQQQPAYDPAYRQDRRAGARELRASDATSTKRPNPLKNL